jgi:hypothetical protein
MRESHQRPQSGQDGEGIMLWHLLSEERWLRLIVFPDVWRTAPADIVSHPSVSEAKRQDSLD